MTSRTLTRRNVLKAALAAAAAPYVVTSAALGGKGLLSPMVARGFIPRAAVGGGETPALHNPRTNRN
jgi:hypothetical protein